MTQTATALTSSADAGLAPLDESEAIASQALDLARRHGADAADVVMVEQASQSVSFRLGKLEDVERSESRDLGLRVFVGKREASVSSSDLSPAQLERMAERAVAMARGAPEDGYGGLAERELLAPELADLDLYDDALPDAGRLQALAAEAEETALGTDKITNSLGAGAGWSVGAVVLAASNGARAAYRQSSFSLSCSVVAGEGTGMERDYDYSSARHFADLEPAAEIGRRAAERTVARLGPRKAATGAVPVVYDRRVAGGLLGHLAGAVSGAAVARGTSFLIDRLGERVFAEGIVAIDDPLRRRGLRSKPCDGEGVGNAALTLIDDGRLTTWLLDSRSARQLGLRSNGRAARGIGGPPSPAATNLYLQPGDASREELIGAIDQGLYVTDLIGMGVNMVTGDYSRGAAGFWIENGEIAYPVSELTIAGNLKDMFARLTPADDLEFRYGINAPTVRVDGMTVAGS